MRLLTLLLLLGATACLTCSCRGYQFAHSQSAVSPPSISVPYVEGDTDGDLTTRIAEAIAETGSFRYVNNYGQYTLQVKIIDRKEEAIGMRYNTTKSGKVLDYLVPNEARAKILAEITLIETASQHTVLGPTRILASTDFDHEYYNPNQAVTAFSLAQLSDIDTAHEAVFIPRNRELAKRIAEYLKNQLDWLNTR